jgi:hypothetical protein
VRVFQWGGRDRLWLVEGEEKNPKRGAGGYLSVREKSKVQNF